MKRCYAEVVPKAWTFNPGEEQLRGKLDLDVYTLRDIWVRTGMSRVFLLNAIHAGELKALDMGGARGHMVFHQDLMDWLDSKRVRAGSAEAIAAATH
jgi:hypothetical protein